ncbi:MAG: glycoside hydrolase family 127 protein [Sedimentisphaerales bacterium]|nr:glycoside hydrolase family 127 protein [Sedimentisphaerales bacterium]
MKNSRRAALLTVSSLILALSPASCLARSGLKLTPVDIGKVEVAGEIGRRIDVTIANNALVLNADRDFLLPFREKNRQGGYIGLGKFIDSLVRFAAYSHDEKVLALKKHVVRETLATQEQDGYLGTFVLPRRMWHLWDIHEMGYLVLGLTADYTYFREQPSLDAARRLADYILERWSSDPGRTTEGWISVYVATTGLEEAMLSLYEQTDDKRYLDFCVRHRKLADWKTPLIEGRWGNLEGHAYYHLCHCLAQLRLHMLGGGDGLMTQSRRTLDFLLGADGLLAPGLCGYQECWHSNQQGFYKLGETCATAYLLRWLDALLQIEGRSLYGDIMERSIYNGLFAAQSPDGRRLRYYAPFEGPREYFSGDTYCCPCNFRRIIAELPGLVYYGCDDGVAVNLYTPSSAVVNLRDGLSLKIAQETDYPNSGTVVVRLDPSEPARFPVSLRIPRWCETARIRINDGATETTARGGSFCKVARQWRPGDKITLEMPMSFRVIRGRQSQAGRAAVMRGPVLFCLNPERQENLDAETLKLLRLDPASVKLGPADDSIRPNGLTCQGLFWRPGDYNAAGPANLQLTLTEYPDPGCRWTYFLIPNPRTEILTDDELVDNMQTTEAGL